MCRSKKRRTGKALDMVGWIVIGLLAAVRGELIMPSRSPGEIAVTLLVGLVAGAEATEFGTPSILWATPGALDLSKLYRLITSPRRTSREGQRDREQRTPDLSRGEGV